RSDRDWSSDVCSSDLDEQVVLREMDPGLRRGQRAGGEALEVLRAAEGASRHQLGGHALEPLLVGHRRSSGNRRSRARWYTARSSAVKSTNRTSAIAWPPPRRNAAVVPRATPAARSIGKR